MQMQMQTRMPTDATDPQIQQTMLTVCAAQSHGRVEVDEGGAPRAGQGEYEAKTVDVRCDGTSDRLNRTGRMREIGMEIGLGIQPAFCVDDGWAVRMLLPTECLMAGTSSMGWPRMPWASL
jgi:hypothetical protein